MVLQLIVARLGVSSLVAIGSSWALEPQNGAGSRRIGLLVGLASFPVLPIACGLCYGSSLRGACWGKRWW